MCTHGDNMRSAPRIWRWLPPDGWYEHLTRTPKPIEPQAVDEAPVDWLSRDDDATNGHEAAGPHDGGRTQQRRRGTDQQFTSRHWTLIGCQLRPHPPFGADHLAEVWQVGGATGARLWMQRIE